ncbi:hypothetical protein [Bacillus sp. FJAT-53060]|uniref:hypothetical protein n=1 Tax=Bacillus sp. FJAT-53060 TaxID=3127666 RepID=UPI00301383AA
MLKLQGGERSADYEADQVISGVEALTVYRHLIDEKDRPSFLNKKLSSIHGKSGNMVFSRIQSLFPASA